jgi:ABC-2 type transport system ATP-binding protein
VEGHPVVVQITDLTIRYREVIAVDQISLTVAAGQVMGLLGGNGAGKSSTLRAVAGVNPPSSGELVVAGFNMADPHQVEKARQAVGYCPDVGGLIPAATPREHIAATLAFRGLTHLWPQAYDLLEQFELARALDKLTGGFSHGMARRLSVVLATLTAEQVLILDEPFDGVDPGGVDVTLEVIKSAQADGLAVIISSHMLDLIVRSCDSISVMTTGKLVATGPAEQFGGQLGHRRYQQLLRSVA